MGHGIARFSPKFCTDKMRFWSLGQAEAVFWDRNVFQVLDTGTASTQDGKQSSADVMQSASLAAASQHAQTASTHAPAPGELYSLCCVNQFAHPLLCVGATHDALQDMLNGQ